MISFPTQSWLTGIAAETTRRTIVAKVRGGLVSQTIRKSGGTLRSARKRSRQVAGASTFGKGGCCGIKYQCNAGNLPERAGFSVRGPKGPDQHHLPESETGPLFFNKGDVWENQIRRKRIRQNLFVIQIIGPRTLRVK